MKKKDILIGIVVIILGFVLYKNVSLVSDIFTNILLWILSPVTSA